MSEFPGDIRYTRSHEWVRKEDDGGLRVGITDHAQEALGDLVFVDMPEVGKRFAAGDECAVVESVKAASDLYSPVAGEIAAVNEQLGEQPEKINEDPYGEGWIMTIKPDDPAAYDLLLDAAAYRKVAEEDE